MPEQTKPRFVVGDPVMINPDTLPKDQLQRISEWNKLKLDTLYPPLSYTGTVIDFHGGNERALIVKWDHLGDDGHLFFENELRPA